jgi:GNAT superfamily N-acetyltransferase
VAAAAGERPPLVIRPFSAEDEAAILSVLGLARLNQGNGYYLVAWEGAEPVGHVHLALTDPPEIQDLAVVEQHRRRGFATRLLAAAEGELRAAGYDAVRLEVSVEDEGVQSLYRACGYVEARLPWRRVKGKIHLRGGPIHVDATLMTFEKRLTVE